MFKGIATHGNGGVTLQKPGNLAPGLFFGRSAPVPGRSNARLQQRLNIANTRLSGAIVVAGDGHTPHLVFSFGQPVSNC